MNFDGLQDGLLNRNFFCYSIFKISPLFIQNSVYDSGNYNMADLAESEDVEYVIPQNAISPSICYGIDPEFIQNYNVLYNLDTITDIVNDSTDTFMYLTNEITHTPNLVSAPSYEPAPEVDNTVYDAEHASRFETPVYGYSLQMYDVIAMRHYTSNAAAYVLLGRYFDYMREAGVWDNTRIIIVADHSINSNDTELFGPATHIPDTDWSASYIDAFNPVLMVKDFGSSGFNVCDDLMTNADVPYLATCGIIDNPVNPFSGNRIIPLSEYNGNLYIYDSDDWNVTDTEADADAVRYIRDNWYLFNGTNVFDLDSWSYEGVR